MQGPCGSRGSPNRTRKYGRTGGRMRLPSRSTDTAMRSTALHRWATSRRSALLSKLASTVQRRRLSHGSAASPSLQRTLPSNGARLASIMDAGSSCECTLPDAGSLRCAPSLAVLPREVVNAG